MHPNDDPSLKGCATEIFYFADRRWYVAIRNPDCPEDAAGETWREHTTVYGPFQLFSGAVSFLEEFAPPIPPGKPHIMTYPGVAAPLPAAYTAKIEEAHQRVSTMLEAMMPPERIKQILQRGMGIWLFHRTRTEKDRQRLAESQVIRHQAEAPKL